MHFNIRQSLPFIILFILLSVLCRELYSANHETNMPSLTGEPVPVFSLPYINNPQKSFTQQDLRGHVSLINIWASWCSACRYEHPMLMKIKRSGVPIYGILYKDNAVDALQYLTHRGNPFTIVGNDESGDTGVDFGIYGTPETYVINPQGQIIYRHVGALDESVWDGVIYPMIKPYLKKNKRS